MMMTPKKGKNERKKLAAKQRTKLLHPMQTDVAKHRKNLIYAFAFLPSEFVASRTWLSLGAKPDVGRVSFEGGMALAPRARVTKQAAAPGMIHHHAALHT